MKRPTRRARGSRTTRLLLETALREDVGTGDLTTARVVSDKLRGRASVVAREPGIFAGGEAAAWVFHRLDGNLDVRCRVDEGGRFGAGDRILELDGRLAPILTGERLALNLLARLCGVATLTRAYVDAVAGTGVAIVDTRKTTPGWRALERDAVRAGGGVNHRSGLFDAVLVKENHVRAAGGIAPAWRQAVRRSRGRRGADRAAFVQIEVRDLSELAEALAAGARFILLDNFTPRALATAVRAARKQAPDAVLEASGGVTLATVRSIAKAGVDRISVGALTHSARAIDLSLLVEEVGGTPRRSGVAAKKRRSGRRGAGGA